MQQLQVFHITDDSVSCEVVATFSSEPLRELHRRYHTPSRLGLTTKMVWREQRGNGWGPEQATWLYHQHGDGCVSDETLTLEGLDLRLKALEAAHG